MCGVCVWCVCVVCGVGGVGVWCGCVSLLLVRPGKVDSLFLISHFLNLRAGRRSLFIIHYYYIIKILGSDHRKSNELFTF